MERYIPPPFQALLQTLEGAVIIAQTYFLENLVVDAQILAATPEAARLYGFQHPSELEGRFTSQIDHPDDFFAIKLLSVARICGLAHIPKEYDMRIILPDGSIRYLHKQVSQVQYENHTYWVTTSTEISQHEAQPLPDYRHLLSEDAIREWFRLISVAELEQLMRTYAPAKISAVLEGRLTDSVFHSNMSGILPKGQAGPWIQSQPLAVDTSVIDIGLGQTRQLPDPGEQPRYLHRCGACACTWSSYDADPPQCPRTRADGRGLRCGKRLWRRITSEGQERAQHVGEGLSDTTEEGI